VPGACLSGGIAAEKGWRAHAPYAKGTSSEEEHARLPPALNLITLATRALLTSSESCQAVCEEALHSISTVIIPPRLSSCPVACSAMHDSTQGGPILQHSVLPDDQSCPGDVHGSYKQG